MPNNHVHKNRIKKLYEIQQGKCWLCDKPMLNDAAHNGHKNFRSIDHIIPRSKGGPNSYRNCLLACRQCNTDRSNNAHIVFNFSNILIFERIVSALESDWAPPWAHQWAKDMRKANHVRRAALHERENQGNLMPEVSRHEGDKAQESANSDLV